MTFKIVDVIEPDIKFTITESSEVDGTHVLGKIRGEFFVPNGVSRNKRFYPAELWEKVIADVEIKRLLGDRLLFGTIGHDGELGDKGVREGNISHVMTNIMIEGGKGLGEALILNTPTGRILNTMLRAGCKLRVSSRANGLFKGEKDGLPVVDKDNYDLEGWDFVIDAGFLQANPILAESYNSLQKQLNNETISNKDNYGVTMSTENGKSVDSRLAELIIEENKKLKTDFQKVSEELEAVKAEKEESDKEAEEVEKEKEAVAEKLSRLAKYEELGSPEEIKDKLEKSEESEEENAEFKELGDSPEEVKEALCAARDQLVYIRENFGTVAKIKKSLTEAIEFRKQVDAIGSISDIRESLEVFKKITEEEAEAQADAKAQSLADELGLSLEEVKELLDKNSEEEIRKMYAKVEEAFKRKATTTQSHYRKSAPTVIVEGKKEATNEEAPTFASRMDRINERLCK